MPWPGFNPWSKGTEISQAEQHGPKKKKPKKTQHQKIPKTEQSARPSSQESNLIGMGICILVFVCMCVLYILSLFLAF